MVRFTNNLIFLVTVYPRPFFFFFSLKSPAPPLGYLGHSAHFPRSSSISFIHNMYSYSIQIQDGPVWSGLGICSSRSVIFLTIKCCVPSTALLTGGKKFTYAYEGSRSPHECVLHWNPLDFRQKSDTVLTDLYIYCIRLLINISIYRSHTWIQSSAKNHIAFR